MGAFRLPLTALNMAAFSSANRGARSAVLQSEVGLSLGGQVAPLRGRSSRQPVNG